MRHKNLIRLWPTVAEFARDLGQQPARVYKWSGRDSIPPQFWREVVRAAEARGIAVTVDDLLDGATDRAA
jgi:hypothetical protein